MRLGRHRQNCLSRPDYNRRTSVLADLPHQPTRQESSEHHKLALQEPKRRSRHLSTNATKRPFKGAVTPSCFSCGRAR